MIIGVGNGQFTWMYGMGFGVPRRAPGGIDVCVPNVVVQFFHAGMNFNVAWGDVSWIRLVFFRLL
jgi:hypothetical protein